MTPVHVEVGRNIKGVVENNLKSIAQQAFFSGPQKTR